MFNIRTSTSHKVYRFRNQRFWAENGAVMIVDERTGEFQACSLREFLQRADAFNHARKRGAWSDERVEEQRGAEAMVACALDAKQQGDLFSNRVQLEKMRAQGKEPDLTPPDYSKVLKPLALKHAAMVRAGGTVLGGAQYNRHQRRQTIDFGRRVG